jgi:hypothetical protein
MISSAAPGSPSDAELFSMPPEWRVVSIDVVPEQNTVSDWVLNVQQVLYERSGNVLADQDVALQIFSIWGTDREGNEKPIPDGMYETCKDFVRGLIGERYGNVSELGEDIVETALEDLSVSTYETAFSLANGETAEFRYKRTSLYRGERRVLVLLKYKPEFEEHWHKQLEIILNEWVSSLTLTPVPVPVTARLDTSLPIPQPSDTREPPEQPSPVQDPPAPGRVVRPVFALAALICVSCAFYKLAPRRRPQQNEEPLLQPVSAEADIPSAENRSETEPEPEERLVLGDGFNRVYSLLNQALSSLEDGAVPYVRKDQGPTAALPNMVETMKVMDELKETFGDLSVLEALKGEVFKVLEMNSETRRIFYTGNAAPDCLVLTLCRDTLVKMLKTGRYHVGKGILSSEGEELASLHAGIGDLMTQKTCVTPQEAEKDAKRMKYWARESG